MQLHDVQDDALDWNGDHPWTNFRSLWSRLRGLGYAVDIGGKHWVGSRVIIALALPNMWLPQGCYDLTSYGAVLLVDSEDEARSYTSHVGAL
jgi:hypothetical protein